MIEAPTIVDALEMWSSWFCDHSPLGATGDYALDMHLADAFRALLYRSTLNARLKWLEREVHRPTRHSGDNCYRAQMISWWLALFEAEKVPLIQVRMEQRRALCAS